MAPAPDSSFSFPPDVVAFYADHDEKRSRLTTFFRFITVIPHIIWLMLYGIAAGIATIIAWFALLFTAKFPQGIYDFLVDFHRYATRVLAYYTLITDKFPPFNGNADVPYAAHLVIGPPLEKYSRWKVLLRIIIYIPFYIVAYVFQIALYVVSMVAWFAIVITGKEIAGLQNAMTYLFSFIQRVQVWYGLLTEDWPKFGDDEVVADLQAKGYVGEFPPAETAAAPEPTPAV